MQDYSGITMMREQAVPGVDNWSFRTYLETLDRGGEKLQKQIEERSKKLAERPKPAKLCWSTCWIDDERCAACAAMRLLCYSAPLLFSFSPGWLDGALLPLSGPNM